MAEPTVGRPGDGPPTITRRPAPMAEAAPAIRLGPVGNLGFLSLRATGGRTDAPTMSPPKPPHRSRSVAVGAAVALLAGLFLTFGGPVEVDAHSGKWAAAGRASATRFDVGITAWDLSKDGHCAKGRLHLGGRWRTRVTDCSHSPRNSGASSSYTPANGTISASACIDRHGYNSNTCHYGSLVAPFGRVDLGNAP